MSINNSCPILPTRPFNGRSTGYFILLYFLTLEYLLEDR